MQDRDPIAYASKVIITTERNYAQIGKECVAIVLACTKYDKYRYMAEPWLQYMQITNLWKQYSRRHY